MCSGSNLSLTGVVNDFPPTSWLASFDISFLNTGEKGFSYSVNAYDLGWTSSAWYKEWLRLAQERRDKTRPKGYWSLYVDDQTGEAVYEWIPFEKKQKR